MFAQQTASIALVSMSHIAAGEYHSVVVLEDGNVIAFGLNRGGQCNVPTAEVLRGRRATQVAAGYAHSLMLMEDGDVVAIGWNGKGQCNVPTAHLGQGKRAVQVAAGSSHSLLLLNDGSVLAFGGNQYGQCNIPPEEVLQGRRATQVAACSSHSLLLLDDGGVVAFGSNAHGQCSVPTKAQLGGRKVTQVAAGGYHSVVLLEDGSVLTCGSTDYGVCDVPTAELLQLRKVTQVAVYGRHNIFMLDDGGVVETGKPTLFAQNFAVPPKVADQIHQKAIQVAAGGGHTLVLLEDGNLIVYGLNNEGQCDVPDLHGKKVGDVSAHVHVNRHSVGINEILYKEIQDFVNTVTPTLSVSEHFKAETPVAFPGMKAAFIEYYLEKANIIASSRLDAGVTLDLEPMEVWAIVVYTMDLRSSGLVGAGAHDSFYHQLNVCLQKRDMGVIQCIENYLHFLMRGLSKLPLVQPDAAKEGLLVFRGIGRKHVDLIRDKYKEGQNIHWSGITSVSFDEDVARQFASEDGPGGIVFEIRARSARIVGDISAIPTEREAILLPNFRACVVKGLARKRGVAADIWGVELLEKQTGPAYVF